MRLMIVGDLQGQLVTASRIATANGAKVFHVSDTNSALRTLRGGRSAEVIMVDVEQDIASFILNLRSERIHSEIVACGLTSHKDKAVRAIKAGAKEYVPLPPDEEMIAAILEAATCGVDADEVIYKSENFQKMMVIAKKIADSQASVLISGESGTGKEVIANYIHNNSLRKIKEFISVNCAAIPENLLESELFGHEKGSFTGAVDRRIGKFEEANGGTLLLDEISEMDLRLQAKLLRVLQEREIVRVGGNRPIKLDIRIIATTNRNLLEHIRNGNFREDLFFRLNVINLQLPPLRERKEDIEELAAYFIKKYAKLNSIEEKPLSDNAKQKLVSYYWKGNVRELENTIHRSLLLAPEAQIASQDILTTNDYYQDNNAGDTLEDIERRAIEDTVNKYSGDYGKASLVLGISISLLKAKLKKYKIAS